MRQKRIFFKKDWRTHSPLLALAISSVTSSGRLSACPSGPVMPSSRIRLCSWEKYIQPFAIFLKLKWRFTSGDIWMTVVSPQQWCLHSQHAPVQLHQGLWWHWTPHRSKRIMQCQVIAAKVTKHVLGQLSKKRRLKYIPENQKVGKDPYKPNRPGKNWHLKIRVLMRGKVEINRTEEENPQVKRGR